MSLQDNFAVETVHFGLDSASLELRSISSALSHSCSTYANETLWNHSRPTEKYLIKEIKEQLLHCLKEKKKVCIVVVVPTNDS